MTKNKYFIITAVVATVSALVLISYTGGNVAANPTVTFPATKFPEMLIELNPTPFKLNEDGVYVLNANKGDVIAIPLILKSHIDRTVHPKFILTFGPGNEPPVLPPGVNAVFNLANVELPPKAQAASNLVLKIDKDAPDGKYPMSVIAFAEGTDIGNSFQLIVGQGSEYEIGPNGPLIPPTVRAP